MNRLALLLCSCLVIQPLASRCFGQDSVAYSVFPQIAVGDGWSFDIFLTNQDSEAAPSVRLSFYKSTGEPLVCTTNVGSGSAFTFSLLGGTTQAVRANNEGSLRSGYAVLEVPPDISIRGSLVVRWQQNGQVVTQLGVTQQFPSTCYSFPAEVDSDKGVNTGVALALPTIASAGAGSGDIIVSLIDEGGVLQRTVSLSLASGHHDARYLNQDQLFPGLDHFRGSVSVSSTLPFGLIALRQEQAVFGTLAINRGPVVAPHMVLSAAGTEVEPNNSNAQATALNLPAKVAGTIGAPGDVDVYSFSGSQGEILTALTDTRVFGFVADSILTLLKEDGTVLATNDQSGLLSNNDSFLQAVLPSSGKYYLRVEEYSHGGGANYGYHLHVQTTGDPVQPGTPRIDSITPSSALPGAKIPITIRGANLSGAFRVIFTPITGITITNVQSTATQVTASLDIYEYAASGSRQVYVMADGGDSNTINFTITAPAPSIDSINPSSATAGSTVSLEIWGESLAGVTAVSFTPSTGVSLTNLESSEMRVTATLAIAATAPVGICQVTVTTPGGTTNALSFRIRSATPVGQPPTISNLQAGTPVSKSDGMHIAISFDFYDPDGDITYASGDPSGSAKIVFSKGGCTKSFSGTTVDRPGQTSGHFSFDIVLTGTSSGSFSITVQLFDAAWNGSNLLTFNTTVWNCLLLEWPAPSDHRFSPGWSEAQSAGESKHLNAPVMGKDV